MIRKHVDRSSPSGLRFVLRMAVKTFPRIVLVAGILVSPVLTTLAPCQAKPHSLPRAQKHEVRHEIDHMEDSWRAAMIGKDSAALDALLSDDYTGITADGAIQTKEQAVGNLRSGALKISILNTSDKKVRIYGSTAVVTSLAELTGTRDGKEATGRYRYTRVYVRNSQGQWKIVSFEASRIQEPSEHKVP